jgi:hypothetical protein
VVVYGSNSSRHFEVTATEKWPRLRSSIIPFKVVPVAGMTRKRDIYSKIGILRRFLWVLRLVYDVYRNGEMLIVCPSLDSSLDLFRSIISESAYLNRSVNN